MKISKDLITEIGKKIKTQGEETAKELSQKVAESAEHITQIIKEKTK